MGMGGQRHAPTAVPPGKTRYPLYRRLGGPQGRSVRARKTSPPPGFDPRTVQPVASRYTDCVIPAHAPKNTRSIISTHCIGAVVPAASVPNHEVVMAGNVKLHHFGNRPKKAPNFKLRLLDSWKLLFKPKVPTCFRVCTAVYVQMMVVSVVCTGKFRRFGGTYCLRTEH
jgi:hypothetical protein